MADEQILVAGTAAVPLAYTVPNAVEVTPKAASAIFDGTGAAGSFLPTLEIVSPGGVVVAQAPVASADSVAAGASAEVSWFPHVAKPSTSAAVSAPTVATFRTNTALGDAAIVAAAGTVTNLTWAHSSLPSNGLITGPSIGNVFITFNGPCITIEAVYAFWPLGAYQKASVLGTNSRIITADMIGYDNAGGEDLTPVAQELGQWTVQMHPNAHVNGDLLHAYVANGAGVNKNIDKAFLVIYAWAAPGYAGGIPGYP